MAIATISDGQLVLSIREVEQAVGLSRTSIYAGIKSGTFPAPIKLTARKSGWLVAELNDFIRQRIAARAAR